MIKQFSILLIVIMAGISARGTSLSFSSQEYAGQSFVFYTVPNFITEKKKVVGEGIADDAGSLKIELDIDKTIVAYSEFGVYKGWVIVEPDKNYELVMPRFRENRSKNPFFRPIFYMLGVKNCAPDDVNNLVNRFTRAYGAVSSQNFTDLMSRRDVDKAEQLIESLKQKFPETGNKFFENFKKYHYAKLKRLTMISDPSPLYDEYFIGHEILYSHPSYAEVFDAIFSKYLQHATQDVNGHKISAMINTGAYQQLMDWMIIDEKFPKKYAEAIALKGMKRLFYSNRFNTTGIYTILDQIMKRSEEAVHRDVARSIFTELAQTRFGSTAPMLSLIDLHGQMVTWDNFTGKYVYLCFTSTINETFKRHKELLAEIYTKFKKDLEVVVVLEDDNLDPDDPIFQQEGLEWTLLRGKSRREIYNDFNVNISPTYFLIDRNAQMAGSQAAWPDENFSQTFNNTLRATEE